MDIKIIQTVLDVFDEYGETIRFDLERFEEALNDEGKDLLEECFLVVSGFKWGIFDAMIFDEEIEIESYVHYLMDTNHLSQEESVFLTSVLYTLLKQVGYYFEIPDIDYLTKDAYQRLDLFQLSLIAKSYRLGFGVNQDYEKSFEINSFLYSQGYEKVAYELGYLYEHGYGVEKDLEKAYLYYHNHEDDMCFYRLGLMYMNGNYVSQDEQKAINAFSLSHYKEAYLYKGILLEHQGEYALAFESFIAGTKQYQRECFYKVGYALKRGVGVILDLKDAYHYFQYGYYLLNKDCSYELALMNFDGLVHPKNVKQALHYLKEAAMLNSYDACLLLAQFYESGQYVTMDFNQASLYYQKAKEMKEFNKESFEVDNEDI